MVGAGSFRWDRLRVIGGVGAVVVAVLVVFTLIGGGTFRAGGSDTGWDGGLEYQSGAGVAAESSSIAYDTVKDGSGMAEPGGPAPVVDNQVRNASLTVEVGDVPGTVAKVRELADAGGGFVQSSEMWSSSEGGHMVVRVRDEGMAGFLDGVRDLGRVTSESVSTVDVSRQYDDLGARIPVLEAELEALLGMLSRAGTVTDELTVRDRVVSVQSDLASLRAQLVSLEDADSFATVTVSLHVPAGRLSPSTVDVPWFTAYELQLAFANGWGVIRSVTYAAVTFLVVVSPVLVAGGVAALVRRHRRRDSRAG